MEPKTAAARSVSFMVAAVGVWWVANIIATIASKSVMRGGDARTKTSSGLTLAFRDLRWVELTALQHLVGAVLAGAWVRFKGRTLWPAQAREQKYLILIAALGNVVGNAATNAAYSLITSSTAQVIKACEPLFTFGLTLLLYRNYATLDVSTLLSVVIIVVGAGAFLMGDATFNLWGVFAAMISNTAFPTRNIFLKKLSDIWDNPLQKFAVMSAFSVAFLLPIWLIKVVFVSGFSFDRIFESMVSSGFHSTYNLASITVLETVNPVTHAILNISKRLFVIMANIVYFHVAFSFNMFVSLVVLLIGCYLYQLKNSSTSKFVLIKSVLLVAFVGYLCIPSSTGGTSLSEVHNLHSGSVFPPTTPPLPDNEKSALSKLVMSLNDESASECSRENRILTSWIYYESIPNEAVDNILALARLNPGTPVFVFCGRSQCMDAIGRLKNERITAEFAVLPNIVKDTPLQAWLALHPIHKVLAGKDFEAHLQEATVLSLLLKYGGFYVDPVVRITSSLDIPKCQNNMKSWVSEGPPSDVHESSPRVFDAAYFPRNDTFVRELAKRFGKDFPTEGKKGSPFRFDFRSKAWSMIRSSCETCPVVKRDVNFEGTRVSVETALSRKQHFATLSYDSRIPHIGLANLGDEIQGFPGMQFLPFVDRFVQRDTITAFRSDGNVSMFFNAWWGSEKASWPPPNNIDPVMLSIHIAPPRMGVKWAQHIGWAKQHEPIGCRDSDTMKFLHDHGVKAFFTACLTLFMKNPNVGIERSKDVYLVDLKKEHIDMLPQEIQDRGIRVYHNLKNARRSTNALRYTEAYKLIRKYGQASVVVTQRIHCALPCIGMGTPVIFINSAGLPGGGGSSGKASGRTSGLTPLFHTLSLYDKSKEEARAWLRNFPWDNPPPNPDVSMTMKLRATSWNVIRQHPIYYDTGKKFGIIPMTPPTTKIAGKTYVFHLVFTTSNATVIGTSSSGEKQFGAFNWRHWRSIESIFYHHPTSEVVVHSNTLSTDMFNVFTEVGYSIRVQKYNLKDLLHDSPAEEFATRLENARKGSYWHIHETDLLSLLILYQQGGVYLSTDIILVQPIDRVPTNSIGWDSEKNNTLSGAFLIFEKKNTFLKTALSEFADYYDGMNLANGQSLLTDTWGKTANHVVNVHILPYFYFYAVHSSNLAQQCFKDTEGKTFEANHKLLESKTFGMYLNSTVTGHFGVGRNKLAEGTICRDLLTSYCVLCSNLH